MTKSTDVIAGRYYVLKSPIEERTLRGGFGEVYLCADLLEDGRAVGLKTFQSQFLSNRVMRDRFLREADIWIRLGRHPNIVRAHHVLYDPQNPAVYVVMDWVAAAEGKRAASLRDWLTPGRPLDAARALGWALQVARAMKHATTIVPGLIHRDLKPENLLVGRDEHVRVTDFGLARAAAEAGLAGTFGTDSAESDGSTPIVATTAAGTFPYMAPEQFEAGALDLRIDVYAFGILVIEMLTGRLPVQVARGISPPEAFRAYRELHRSGEALALAESLSADVRQWLGRCLAVRPNERYSTWDEVEAALQQVYPRATAKSPPGETSPEQEMRDDRIAAGWSLIAIGASYDELGKSDAAVGYMERALRIGIQELDRTLEGASMANIGRAYRKIGKAREALEVQQKALAIARETSDRGLEASVLHALGSTYLALKDPHRAKDCHEQCVSIAREIGAQSQAIEAVAGLGSVHGALGDFPRMIECYEEYFAFARSAGDRAGQGRALGNLGDAYRAIGDHDKAITCLREAVAISVELGDPVGEAQSTHSLALAFGKQGDGAHAWTCAESADHLYRALGRVDDAEKTELIRRALCLVENANGDLLVRGTMADLERAERLYTEDREVEALAVLHWMLGLSSENLKLASARLVSSLLLDEYRCAATVDVDRGKPSRDLALRFICSISVLRGKCFAAIMSPAHPAFEELLPQSNQHLYFVEQIFPDDVYLMTLSAQVLFLRGNVAPAMRTLEKALALEPDSRHALGTRHFFQSKDGYGKLTHAALAIIARCADGGPAGDPLRRTLGRAHTLLQQSLAIEQQQPRAWAGLAWILASFEHQTDAVKALRQAEQMDSADSLVRELLEEFRRRGWWEMPPIQ